MTSEEQKIREIVQKIKEQLAQKSKPGKDVSVAEVVNENTTDSDENPGGFPPDIGLTGKGFVTGSGDGAQLGDEEEDLA